MPIASIPTPAAAADTAAAGELALDQPLFDGVDLRALAAQVGTPCHVYSAGAIRQRIGALQAALQGLDAGICYAVKANGTLAVLQLMHEQGVGADIVSAGELHRALRAGIPGSRIVFSGVGKTGSEIHEALVSGVGRFNVESLDELQLLECTAGQLQLPVHASVRVNPDVDAGTHEKISTGKAENKFGVSLIEARRWFDDAAQLRHVRLDGLHVHIGSQILSLSPFRLALQRVAGFWRELEQAGHSVACIDVGGGLGVRYRRGHDRPVDVAAYVAVIRETLAGFQGRLLLEPGRHLVAEAGVLLTRAVRVKHGERRRFLVLDAAMNDLLRPSLYSAWHDIVPLHGRDLPELAYDVVGPVCETGDTFAVGRNLPKCKAGDLLAILGTGAYGASMGSTYNSRPLPPEVLVDAGRYAVVRRRQTLEEMMAAEQPARDWQEAK